MHRTIVVFALTSAVWIARAEVARADLPPPEGYVEGCTAPKAQERTKQTCQSCNAWHGEPEACATQFDGTTFAHECRTRGASTWSEMWCDPNQPLDAEALAANAQAAAADGDHPPPSDGNARGCAIERGADLQLALVWLLLPWLARRRAT